MPMAVTAGCTCARLSTICSSSPAAAPERWSPQWRTEPSDEASLP